MQDVKVNKERKLIDLEELSLEDLEGIIRNKQIELYENELELLDLEDLGLNLHEIGEKETNYVFHFLDDEMVNPTNHKKTKNDFLNSFIMTFDNHEEITNLIWEERKVTTGYDKDGNELIELRSYIKDYPLYRKWSSRSMKYWNDKDLYQYIDNFRQLLEGNLDRAEILKDVIYRRAISDDVSERVMLDSTRQMIDILGLKNVRDTSGVNVFISGGGKQMANSMEKITGNVFDVTKLLGEEDE